jgi:acyl carrier protein
MTNAEKYLNVFKEVLNVTDEQTTNLIYQGIENWDSVGHLSLISALEDAFGIMMDTEDIIDFSSYEKGKEILATNYEIEF